LKLAQFALLTLASTPIFAQRFEIGPYYSYLRPTHADLGTVRDTNGSDSDTHFSNAQGFGLRLTYNTKGYYGHEIHYERTKLPLTSNVDPIVQDTDGSPILGDPIHRHEKLRVTQFGYNFMMYMMPLQSKWRPFITVGAASIYTKAPLFPEWTQSSSRNFGGNFGGGIKLAPIKHFLFRMDFRYQYQGAPFALNFPDTQKTQGNIHQMQVSAGFSYTFGK